MNQGGPAISLDNEVRGDTKKIAAFAFAPKIVGDQPEVLDDFKIPVDGPPAACPGEILLCDWIEQLDRAFDAGDLEVSARSGIKGYFGDDIWMDIRCRHAVSRVLIEFGSHRGRQCGG